MNTTANVLGPRLLRDATRPPTEALSLKDAQLPRFFTLDVDKIPGLDRFEALVLLIPKSSTENRPRQSVKPNSLQKSVVSTKVRSILEQTEDEVFRTEYRFGQVMVNFAEMTASRAGEPIVLTATEFRVLEYMVRRERQVITRDDLLSQVMGYSNYPSTRTIDNHIFQLRQRLEQDPSNPIHLLTVWGAGYKFVSGSMSVVKV